MVSKDKRSWREAKQEAYDRQGGRCSLCGRYVQYQLCVGHHRHNRRDGGSNHPSNCEVRCKGCETTAHRKWKDGNPPQREQTQINYYFRAK